ncbi:MAG: plasmid pRiA4b ORF-3 family protein [Solirubrobacterales bacterium]|nr:plasmid pRiA4b ORF-3 family protein [Solirubrobacterales bacterium]MBA3584973.1 plasmid pRiA4b ORF-3 family protein [Gemmatimonadota bacterium]
MSKLVFQFDADLVGFPGVRRTIAVRSGQTLLDLHDALQAAFEWDDDHLYSFWLSGEFWESDGSEYTHPFHAALPDPLGVFATGPAPKSADVRLDRLRLAKGQRIAYVFDFGDEWRVLLRLSAITADDGRAYPVLRESAGDAPPQYPEYDTEEDAA